MSISSWKGVKTLVTIASIIVITLFQVSQSFSAQWPGITAESLLTWMDTTNPPLVLDVRGRSAYRAGTLLGAFNAGIDPLGYLPDDTKDAVVMIIPVDAGPVFVDAWFKRLTNAGHEVWVLEKGLAAWVKAGGKIEKSEVSYIRPGSVPFVIPKGMCEGGEPSVIFK